MTDPANDAPTSPSPASRLGLSLFVVYTLLYLGFVLLNAFATDTMDIVVFAGLNLAIVYGFGLILAAIAMAFVYGFALRSSGNETDTSSHGGDVA
ncbi:DUF485 domain-containing protein [Allorhodopirellula heiligendammensis]|uniref:DUF485 domain-containing protein n=1 Tax=Allorhodopirellula heiligendammensis TaxID=2714739 RepID=A0A5C6BVV0_9BACT|nr:DUF485 domain-containing protein [Allorhodopirellula heiligendammensis]TWU15551.1 hypothetical protein Poly21_27480 [Allorhodopirellula heiligendammensis]